MTIAVAQAVMEVETLGVQLRVRSGKVVVRFPAEELRDELSGQLAFLRRHKHEVMSFLRERDEAPAMPAGVHLLSWNLKEPPLAVETCSIVTDSALFVRTTLEQLRIALAMPKRWVGWTVPELIDRLAHVGVIVELETRS